jgi:type I restriction enzyme, S subunit
LFQLKIAVSYPVIEMIDYFRAAIVQCIRDSTATIVAAAKRMSREIELLQEYRTRVIADVVTGKLAEEEDRDEETMDETGAEDVAA